MANRIINISRAIFAPRPPQPFRARSLNSNTRIIRANKMDIPKNPAAALNAPFFVGSEAWFPLTAEIIVATPVAVTPSPKMMAPAIKTY